MQISRNNFDFSFRIANFADRSEDGAWREAHRWNCLSTEKSFDRGRPSCARLRDGDCMCVYGLTSRRPCRKRCRERQNLGRSPRARLGNDVTCCGLARNTAGTRLRSNTRGNPFPRSLCSVTFARIGPVDVRICAPRSLCRKERIHSRREEKKLNKNLIESSMQSIKKGTLGLRRDCDQSM